MRACPQSKLEISICLWLLGASSQTPTGPLPLDPVGGLPSPRPPLLSPVANSWLRPCIQSQSLVATRLLLHNFITNLPPRFSFAFDRSSTCQSRKPISHRLADVSQQHLAANGLCADGRYRAETWPTNVCTTSSAGDTRPSTALQLQRRLVPQ